MHYRKQLWGVFRYVVLSVLREVTVGHIASGRLHVTEYVFPDVPNKQEESGVSIELLSATAFDDLLAGKEVTTWDP